MTEWHDWREAPAGDYAVVGDPVSHSLSPAMHAAAYRALGLPLVYRALRVPLADFEPAMERLDSLGYVGVNVTVPLKERAFDWSQGGDPRMGAVNAIRFEGRQGTNTDAPGFLRTLDQIGVSPCQVLLLGAGGSARSVAVALADAGYAVRLHNRTRSRALNLVRQARIAAKVLDEPDPTGCGLVVNATSSGLTGEAPCLLWDRMPAGAVAYDLFYTQGLTPYLREAAAVGVRTVDGRPLVVAQGALSFHWWTGISPPVEAMLLAVQ